ncbi:MAG TPA: adenylate/guanylate cyclase domain-containing protein [Candidatus Limnocylindrales bacterium]|nr:adenylate/guanylate cyclase domain-containing protein [Candidatus Limnocylindrales bacterium]
MRCGACGAPTRPTARFCDQCGASLVTDGRGERAERPRDDIEAGDRRIVTALFADLVDYVRLVAEHDPEDVRRKVDAALRAMVEAIQAYDGTREKFIGDAVFAVFGWPHGHEDDAQRAAHCALAIREALATAAGPAGEPLEVRIGIATGEVVAGLRSDDALDWSLTGPAVTTAARIQAMARPGEILLDEATLRATRKALQVEDIGPQLLRGQIQPIRVARLLGEAGFQPWRPPAGRIVGREAERARLREIVDDLARGRGATIVIEGDAGIGKSRLMADMADAVRAAGLAATWVDNVSYGAREPYRFGRALAQAIADEHGIDSGAMTRRLLFTADVPEELTRRWAGAVAAIARDAAFSGWEEEAPLAPADPAAVADAIVDLAARYSARLIEVSGPRAVFIDDLHWLDPSSAGMLDALVRETGLRPLVLVIGTRPGPTPADATLATVERLSLAGLDEPETRELAAAVAGAELGPSDGRRLHERTAGNPLFIAETVRAIFVDGPVAPGGVAHADGRLPDDGGTVRPGLPMTLRALLGARIDALDEEAKTVLRVASVIGVTFETGLVEEVLGDAVESDVYDRLDGASLIVPLDTQDGWRFSHPLIHDAAYWGLLASTRRRLHALVADRLQAEGVSASIGVVARHRAAAEDADRAVPLLVRAAEEAAAVGASAEAASFWTAAADLDAPGAAADEYRQRARAALEAVPAGRSASTGASPSAPAPSAPTPFA